MVPSLSSRMPDASSPLQCRPRRHFLPAALGWTLVLLAALGGGARCRSRGERSGPDVLLLVMDTARADRCSFLGYGRPTTPRLAELAKESVVFTDAWSPSPWTFPAHAALFTGRTPERLGIVAPWPPVLSKEETTLAEVLGAAGWSTACFTNNGWLAPHTRLTQGFDVVDPVYLSPGGESAREAHSHALEWMAERRRAGRPFFAFVNDVEPHAPYDPPRAFAERFLAPNTPPAVVEEARGVRYPRSVLDHLGRETVRADVRAAASDLYDAEIAQLDAAIGELLDGMRREGLLDGTLVVIAGDHGEGLWDHGWMEHGTLLHRELLRVPLLIRLPRDPAGRVVGDVVRLQDVFPTIARVCGVAPPSPMDAYDLLGDTAGRTATAAERTRHDIAEATERAAGAEAASTFRVTRRSVYDGRHHLIVDDRGGAQVFDVTEDPGERRDLAPERPDLVESLRAKLLAQPAK